MLRVLLTGMSGTGKSTLIQRVAGLGYKAIDTDDGFSEWVPLADGVPRYSGATGEWLWREDLIRELLATEDADVLFVSGCVRNQSKFYSRFDHVVLLSAPRDVIVERLRTRGTNPYGKRDEDVAEVVQLQATVEPLLRKSASLELVTTESVDETVNRLLALIRPLRTPTPP